MGEAPARSSLVPQDLTAELCLIALASLGALRLTAFFISRYWAAFCALSFAVVFSVVGSLLAFPLLSRLFLLGAFLYCSCGCIPSGDALGILLVSEIRVGSFRDIQLCTRSLNA